jgi:hypothetical protein
MSCAGRGAFGLLVVAILESFEAKLMYAYL